MEGALGMNMKQVACVLLSILSALWLILLQTHGLGSQQLALYYYAYSGYSFVHGHFALGGITFYLATVLHSPGEDDSPNPSYNKW